MTSSHGGGSNRRGLAAGLLVVLNLCLLGLNLDKQDALPFSTGLWSNDSGASTAAEGSEVDAGDGDGTADDEAAAPSTDTSADGSTGDTTALGGTGGDSPRGSALQAELNRITSSTPIIFASGATTLSELHARILNSVASILSAYTDLAVTVVGFTDGAGTPEANDLVSLQRAEAVRSYLVSQGVSEEQLLVQASGESTSSGSEELALLERRVEFQVGGGAVAADGASPTRIAVVAPSARNDVAFTQSMVEAIAVVATERGDVEVDITDNTFVVDDAVAAIRGYADEGYDLVIVHGSQFGQHLVDIAPDYPNTSFAWGTGSGTFGLPNVYAYTVSAEEGAYVLGALATMLSTSKVVGIVGPHELGDAQAYVDGFEAGAVAESPGTAVRVTYTGSYSDTTLAADAARQHVEAGTDVMTGSSQMVVGAVSVASENGTLWFGNQANQASLAPELVVASQVYHWEGFLRQVLAGIDAGSLGGESFNANLENGGIVIEYNPGYDLSDEVRARADELVASIASGAVVPLAG